MKSLKSGIIAFALMFGLLSCTNSNDASNKTETKPIDTASTKTIIVDVRTVEEWADDGHANCSVNYPLAELDKKTESLKAYNKIVVVCRSGSRAEAAKELLEQAGIKNVENKGAWQNIDCK
jgi:rhodanese-related sulfurtransferase